MPALVRGVGLDLRRAAGTNLVVGPLLGVAGFATHASASVIEWDLLVAGLAGALPGAWLGPRVTALASEDALRLALGAVLAAIGIVFGVQAAT